MCGANGGQPTFSHLRIPLSKSLIASLGIPQGMNQVAGHLHTPRYQPPTNIQNSHVGGTFPTYNQSQSYIASQSTHPAPYSASYAHHGYYSGNPHVSGTSESPPTLGHGPNYYSSTFQQVSATYDGAAGTATRSSTDIGRRGGVHVFTRERYQWGSFYGTT